MLKCIFIFNHISINMIPIYTKWNPNRSGDNNITLMATPWHVCCAAVLATALFYTCEIFGDVNQVDCLLYMTSWDMTKTFSLNDVKSTPIWRSIFFVHKCSKLELSWWLIWMQDWWIGSNSKENHEKMKWSCLTKRQLCIAAKKYQETPEKTELFFSKLQITIISFV